MLLIAAVFVYFFHRFVISRYRQRNKIGTSLLRESGVNLEYINKVGGNVKGLIVEENGVDVLYVVDTERRPLITGFQNSILNPSFEHDEDEKRIDIMVQRSKLFKPEIPQPCQSPSLVVHEDHQVKTESQTPSVSTSLTPRQNLPQSPQLAPSPPPPPPQSSPIILESKKTQPPPPPPPPPTRPPPPPPGPPPLPKASGFISSLKPPPAPKGKTNIRSTKEGVAGESSREKGVAQTRLKPLHWDKVVANVDHSTVWDQINDGSFRYIYIHLIVNFTSACFHGFKLWS